MFIPIWIFMNLPLEFEHPDIVCIRIIDFFSSNFARDFEKWCDDSRYCECFIDTRLRGGWGGWRGGTSLLGKRRLGWRIFILEWYWRWFQILWCCFDARKPLIKYWTDWFPISHPHSSFIPDHTWKIKVISKL